MDNNIGLKIFFEFIKKTILYFIKISLYIIAFIIFFMAIQKILTISNLENHKVIEMNNDYVKLERESDKEIINLKIPKSCNNIYIGKTFEYSDKSINKEIDLGSIILKIENESTSGSENLCK